MTEVTNRHPVDELADLRAEIGRLEGRADYLRRMILAGECSMSGDDHHAVIRRVERAVIDTKALRKELGDAAVRPFMSLRVAEQVFVRDGQSAPAFNAEDF